MTSSKLIAFRRTRERPSAWWLEYGQRNPIATLTAAVLTCGGLILMGFFLRIEFMPDVDLAGSSALLLAAALVGLGTLFAAVLILAVPGLATSYFLDDVRLKVGLKALAFLVLPAVAGAALIVFQAVYFPANLLRQPEYTVAILVALVVASALIGARFATEAQSSSDSIKKVRYIERAWALFTSGFMWLVSVTIAVKIALTMAADSGRGVVVVAGFIALWLAFVIFINVVTTQFPLRSAWLAAPLMGLLSLGLLTLMMGTFSTFSATTVRVLGFGELGNVDIVVRPEACQALRQSAASKLRCDGGLDGGSGVLRNVALRSRIGGQVVVENARERGVGAHSGRVILRKEDIVMWALRGSTSN